MHLGAFLNDGSALDRMVRSDGASPLQARVGRHTLRVVRTERALLSLLDSGDVEGVVYEVGQDPDRLVAFLKRLRRLARAGTGISPARTIPVFAKEPSPRMLLTLGELGVREVAVGHGRLEPAIDALAEHMKPGRTVLCLAGGGMDGLMYELGVLLALEEVLGRDGLASFDAYYGISAGSILATMLAARFPPSEMARAFYGTSRLLPEIADYIPFDANLAGLARRLLLLALRLREVEHSPRALVEWLSSIVPAGMFKGDRIEEYIHRMLVSHLGEDSFEALGSRLYIGVTDQDTGEHILLGTPGHDDIPVSRAVHASMALVPLFAPQFIGGRWLVDGSISRTTEAEPALEDGATLLVILDPLVPVRGEPGFVQARGGAYEFIQMLKSLIHTRSLEELPHLMETHPFTDFFVFEPEENSLVPMSGSPLRYGFRVELVPVAKDSALRRIERHWARFKRAFDKHGMPARRP